MSDAAVPPVANGAPSPELISMTLVIYALLGVAAVAGLASSGFPLIAPLMGIVGIIAIILGILFQRRRASDSRNELVIFLTPRIVNRAEALGR